MELVDARRLTVKMMKKYGLKGWTYATNKRKRTLGLCFSRLKRIELSINFIAHNPPSVVIETILHEIAHAIVGTEHGHDDVWRDMAVQVGASPNRTTKDVTMPHGKWQANCGGCGLLFSRHRRPKYPDGSSCRRCGPELGQLHYKHIGDYKPAQRKPRHLVTATDSLAVAAHVPAKKRKTTTKRSVKK